MAAEVAVLRVVDAMQEAGGGVMTAQELLASDTCRSIVSRHRPRDDTSKDGGSGAGELG